MRSARRKIDDEMECLTLWSQWMSFMLPAPRRRETFMISFVQLECEFNETPMFQWRRWWWHGIDSRPSCYTSHRYHKIQEDGFFQPRSTVSSAVLTVFSRCSHWTVIIQTASATKTSLSLCSIITIASSQSLWQLSVCTGPARCPRFQIILHDVPAATIHSSRRIWISQKNSSLHLCSRLCRQRDKLSKFSSSSTRTR